MSDRENNDPNWELRRRFAVSTAGAASRYVRLALDQPRPVPEPPFSEVRTTNADLAVDVSPRAGPDPLFRGHTPRRENIDRYGPPFVNDIRTRAELVRKPLQVGLPPNAMDRVGRDNDDIVGENRSYPGGIVPRNRRVGRRAQPADRAFIIAGLRQSRGGDGNAENQ